MLKGTTKNKKEISIPQHAVSINLNNKYMGGVNLNDNGVVNNELDVIDKKWWWPLLVTTVHIKYCS